MSFRDIFSINKKNYKRSRSPTSSPSESNSFVGNMTSRMRKLVPSLSKWFRTSPVPEGSDTSDEEEQQAPPAKRFRLTSTDQHSVSEPINVESDQKDNILYSSIQAGPSRSTFIREDNYSTPYSAVYKETHRDETINTDPSRDTVDRDTTYTKRKSIFDTDSKPKEEKKPKEVPVPSTPPAKEHREPRFRPSLYGSPFYPGPTMYGGASASSCYNRPIIKHMEIKVKEPPKAASSDLSAASQKIMDLLENYPSPLMEAKRIPVFQRPTPNALRSQPSTSKQNSYKTQELQVASVAKMLRQKQRSKLMETNKVARQIMASHSSTNPAFFNSNMHNKSDSYKMPDRDSTSKIKTSLTRINRGEDPHSLPEPVHLPTAVLHIDYEHNLPKFSFTTSTPAKQTDLSQKTNMSPESTLETQKMSIEASMFKFASPVPISQDMNIPLVVSSLAYGSEQSPEPKVSKATSAPEPLPVSAPLIPLVPLVAADAKKEKDWKCDDCWITNKSSVDKCAACGASKPGAKKHAEPPQPQPTVPLPKMDDKLAAIVRAQKANWECSSCLTLNNADKSKCQCCDMEREGPSKEITPKLFMFPKESNASFKFGIDPTEQEKNLAKKTEVNFKLDTKTTTETNNNIAALPSFAKTSNKSDEQDSVVPTQVKFSFGIPKANTETPAISVTTPPQKPAELSTQLATPPTFAPGFLAPSKPVQVSPPGMLSKPLISEETKKADVPTMTHFLATPTKSISEDTNKNAIASFNTSDKPLTFSFSAGSSGSNSGAPGGFSFGVNRSSAASTTATEAVVPSVSIYTSPQPSAAEVPTKNIFGASEPTPSTPSAPPPAQPAATSLFSFGTNPAQPPAMFSFGPTNESTTFGAVNKEATPFGAQNKEATPFGVPNKDATPFGAANKEATPFGAPNNKETTPFGAPNKETTPFGAPNKDATPFGATINKNGTPFGATNQEASPFGTPNAFMMNTNSNSGGNGLAAPMSAGEAPSAASTFGSNDSRPFAFGSNSPFGAPATNPAPTHFSAQSVFSQAPASTQSSGLFASPQQPVAMFGAQNIFIASSQQSAFSGQSPPSVFRAPQNQRNAFGASNSTPAPGFGAQNQMSSFGAPTQNQSPAFGAPAQSLTPTFGAPSTQPAAFGAPSQNTTPAFGVTSQPAASSSPMFNFGSQASSSQGIFGFGQQQQQQQQQQQPAQQPAFNFGSNAIGGLNTSMGGMGGMMTSSTDPSLGAVQFNVGSAPVGNNARRMRKAVRRTQPR